MICRVSRVSGTSGMNSVGRESGSSPWSPTVGTRQPNPTAAAVSTTIATSGAGTAVVSRGSNARISRLAASIG